MFSHSEGLHRQGAAGHKATFTKSLKLPEWSSKLLYFEMKKSLYSAAVEALITAVLNTDRQHSRERCKSTLLRERHEFPH